MAEIIDKNLEVQLGQLIRVKNLKKTSTENTVYVALQVQDQDGENERCILFTQIEIADMQKIQAQFLNKMVCGRIYKFQINKIETNIVKVKNYSGETKFFRISKSQLKKAEKRAEKNKQDLTKKSPFTNMMD